MMPGANTVTDWEARFRPRGAGRFVGAAFLSVWLCGWAAGEAFVLFVLGAGAVALATGQPVMGRDQPLTLGPALAVGAFLTVWLTFWTLGGIAAMREWLRLVWAEDRLAVSAEGLWLSRRLGPFRSTRRLAGADLRRVFVQPRRSTLMAETDAGVVELTNLGTVQERTDAAAHLRRALAPPDERPGTAPDALPKGWEEIHVLPSGAILVPNLRTRRNQARVMAAVALAASVVLLLLVRASLRDPNLWALTVMAGAAAAGLVWGAASLWWGRKEWVISPGKLTLQKRFAGRGRVLGEARALELTERKDSDGDEWYELGAWGRKANATTLRSAGYRAIETDAASCQRFVVSRALHDPDEPRRLGLWLAGRAAVPFTDRVPDEAARRAEQARLREALARSGKLGAWLARLTGDSGGGPKTRRGGASEFSRGGPSEPEADPPGSRRTRS